MSLHGPKLDDRSFQDLVDHAKRYVQHRNPHWTDHNVSDPGVTVIEAAADMVDQLLYRLNRVPELLRLRFMELVGMQLRPPQPASAAMTFELARAVAEPLAIPEGSEVATAGAEPVSFHTIEPVLIPAVNARRALIAGAAADMLSDATPLLIPSPASQPSSEPVEIFQTGARTDELWIGLTAPAPRCLVRLDFTLTPRTGRIDPNDPPWEWLYSTRGGLVQIPPADLRDGTGGFNRNGSIDIHLGPDAAPMSPPKRLDDDRGAPALQWIVCRNNDFPESPLLSTIRASVMGVTALAEAACFSDTIYLGESDATAHQRFPIAGGNIVPADTPPLVEVSAEVDGETRWYQWQVVDHFAETGPSDAHCRIDYQTNSVEFGPEVLQPDGSLRVYGRTPGNGAGVRITGHRVVQLSTLAVGVGEVRVKRSVPGPIAKVYNRRPIRPGQPAESVEDAAERLPITLRTRDRAVTATDFELLTVQAAPDAIASAACVKVDAAATARVVVVPRMAAGPVGITDFNLTEDARDRVVDYLEPRRLLGWQVDLAEITPRPVSIEVTVEVPPRQDESETRAKVEQALWTFLHPNLGGHGRDGWPLGGELVEDDLRAIIRQIPGVRLLQLDLFDSADLLSATAKTERIQFEHSQAKTELPVLGYESLKVLVSVDA